MDQQAKSLFTLDVDAIRQKAFNQEVRRRCPSSRRVAQKSQASPQMKLQRQRRIKEEKPLAEHECHDSVKSNPNVNLEKGTIDPLSTNILDQINQHKSLIAELRPDRRKIKWNQQLSDWERKPLNRPKTDDSPMFDLQGVHIHLSNNLHKSFASLDIFDDMNENPSDHIDEIEHGLEKCFKTIRRIKKETQTNDRKCQELQQARAAIRKELLQLPLPPRQQPMRQARQQLESTKRHLKAKQNELDEQIGMLRMQHNRLAADIAMARELLEEEDKTKAVEFLHASFRIDDDSEVGSHLAGSASGETIQSEISGDPDDSIDISQSRSLVVPTSRSLSLSKKTISFDKYELDSKRRKPATPAAA
jgi:archaellum component FlaC